MTATEPTTASLRRYVTVVLAGWLALAAGAFAYARMQSLPIRVAAPAGAAMLIEFPFYLLPGFADLRDRVAGIGRARLAAVMAGSAALPWLAYSVPSGVFHAGALGLLAAICVAVAFWYVVLPRGAAADALFLILLASIVLARLFHRIYLDPAPKLSMEYLGHVMLIRLAAMEVLAVRGGVRAEFRFWPGSKEWIAGLRWFAPAAACAAGAYWWLGLADPRPHPLGAPLALATFFGVLWVVALSEEFFFRGLLQNWLERGLGSAAAALVLASMLFGAAHLAFRHAFPNWRFSTVAAITGVFYGLAWREKRSVQASMVTHALVVTAWRVFFK